VEFIRGGTVRNVGSSELLKTGGWRTFRPIVDRAKCKRCVICSQFCPDGLIWRAPGEDIIIDYAYCKGCGTCAHECPFDAIEMVREEI